MPQKLREKIKIKSPKSKPKHIKVRYLMLALGMLGATAYLPSNTQAANCPNLRVVFARGSGGEHNRDPNYLAYKSSIESKLQTTNLSYEFIDLDYPAVSVGLDNLTATVGAYVGSGDVYEFGESVNTGARNLINLVNNECLNTKYVLGGYSQGAMVVSKSLSKLKPDKLIYAATFGDPKIYLPEGRGIIPDACKGKNLSNYRMYVPDCQAYKGLLGAYIPYQPDGFDGKVGTWCNKKDIFCSSRFDINSHLGYIADDLYEDASKVIFDKTSRAFNIKNSLTSPHDTVIVIDSTESMDTLIDIYKDEAFRLAKQTFDSGGRVALFDYRDLSDPYQPVEHCNFETCTIDVVKRALDNIIVEGGGDWNESLLSASFHAMKSLKWQKGATKSLVVLTDAGFLNPDHDGITTGDVIRLSKKIDPVNFYIVTLPENAEFYQELALETGGKVITDFGELDLLTDYIMARYDALPRVEEENPHQILILNIEEIAKTSNDAVKVTFNHNATGALVILNDTILGITQDKTLTIADLDPAAKNTLALVPITDDLRGDGVTVDLSTSTLEQTPLPKAPNTGQAKTNLDASGRRIRTYKR